MFNSERRLLGAFFQTCKGVSTGIGQIYTGKRDLVTVICIPLQERTVDKLLEQQTVVCHL
jgi:hypothetical protein